jgi:peptide chain release factor 1
MSDTNSEAKDKPDVLRLLERLAPIAGEKKELEARLIDRAVLSDPKELKRTSYRYKRCEQILSLGERLRNILKELKAAEEMLLAGEEDKGFLDGIRAEIAQLEQRTNLLTSELRALLIPPDERWQRNCIMEIRAAAGGDEAGLFATDLYRMYSRYIERRGWSKEALSSNPTEIGGFKEIVFLVKGEEAFRYMQFESGVHRVQRVPETEASGRIHTSTVTVAVLAEAEEQDLAIDPKDLAIETFRASGKGGQHVNVTDSAVRIRHKPTGLTASCQDERSQHQNRARAMHILRARLQELMQTKEETKQEAERRVQIGTGERSEKIRTYNFPQNRVTDHRIKVSLYRLGEILAGDLYEFHTLLLEAEARRYEEDSA